MHSEEIVSIPSSGNVFADLDLPDPDVLLAKAALVSRIGDVIAERGLTEARAAALVGLDRPALSALLRGRLDDVPIDRLMHFLVALDRDVQIVVRPKQSEHARLTVA